MVATDVRTPPRVRTKAGEAKVEKVAEALTKVERLGEGVGEAVPLEVTQAPGLSTWILLSSDQAKGRPSTQATIQSVEKPTKKNETIKGKPTINKVTVRKVNSTAYSEEVTKSPIILQDSKFKNRTPVVVGRVPTTPVDNQTKTTIVTTTPSTKKKISTAPTQPTKFVEIVPTTSLVVESSTIESTDETSTTETSTTTKRTRRPGTKKKKKNKNRRRRPSKPEDAAESKITQDSNNLVSTKIEGHPNRPLSTRIYNYLAREVMPSVGVGIVGLVLTAGLAGLFLYPFGGGIARRNYEKGTTPQNKYYYTDYVPHREDQTNIAEEKIFTPSASLNHNSYVSSFDSKYNPSKYRYEHDYGASVNGYANEYSTLPDSVKNPDYPLTDDSKYYSMDPVSSQYKLTEVDKYKDDYKDETNYPSLTEYTSYTNAASVGTRGTYENLDLSQNDTKEEDKSDKSQPEFSALVGSPQFTNTDFVGSVSLTGSYGTEGQKTGALASEHGPRALRNKREVHDDFSNEIDVSDDKVLRKSSSPPPTDVSKAETTTDAKTTSESATSTDHTVEHETTTQFNVINYFTDETIKDEPSDPTSMDGPGGLIGFIKRLAQLKLKMGITLLRSTSDAVQRYFDNMAKRMEEAVRHLEKRRRSLLFSSSRLTRDTARPNKTKRTQRKKEN